MSDPNFQNKLCLAAKDGNVDLLLSLISSASAAIDDLDSSSNKYSALHYAAEAGQFDAVSFLLSHGADSNVRSGELIRDGEFRKDWYWEPGHTPLILAARKGHLEIVRSLIKAGADVTLEGQWSWTALHAACVGDHAELVSELLRHGANTDIQCEIRKQSEALGWYFVGTPLHAAANCGSVEAARQLLSHGASTDAACWADRRTPIFYAAARGHSDLISLLCKHRADPSIREHCHNFSFFSDNTPLHYAAKEGHVEAVTTLLKCGAESRARESHTGQTALQMAEAGGHQGVVAALAGSRILGGGLGLVRTSTGLITADCDEERLLRLFRSLTAEDQDNILIRAGMKSVQTWLIDPVKVIERSEAAENTEDEDEQDEEDKEDCLRSAIDAVLLRLHPVTEIGWYLDDWIHNLLEFVFDDGVTAPILGSSRHDSWLSQVIFHEIKEIAANHSFPEPPHFDESEAAFFLSEWRNRILVEIERKVKSKD